MSLRRCPRCPQRLTPAAKFCPRCGKSLRLVPPPVVAAAAQARAAQRGADADAAHEPLSTGGFIAVFGSVIAAGMGVVLLLGSRGNDVLLLMVGLFLLGISLAALTTAVSCMGAANEAAGATAPRRGQQQRLAQPAGLREQPLQSRRLGHP